VLRPEVSRDDHREAGQFDGLPAEGGEGGPHRQPDEQVPGRVVIGEARLVAALLHRFGEGEKGDEVVDAELDVVQALGRSGDALSPQIHFLHIRLKKCKFLQYEKKIILK
jgi:hypothetical protein